MSQHSDDGRTGAAQSAGHDPNVLREPAARDRIVRGRSRLTVRELMEQLDATPRQAQPYVDPNPTNQWLDQSKPVYRTLDDGGPISEDVTQRIPLVRRRTDVPVDLSATATNRRVRTESRHQALQKTPDPVDLVVKKGRSRRELMARDARVAGRVAATAACIVALVGTGTAWAMNGSVNNSWRNVKAIDTNDANIKGKTAQYGDENYLIVGTDTRAGKNSKFGAGDATLTEGARSDTIILINIPANRSRVVAVSFPRDLAVSHPECEGFNNDTGEYTGEYVDAADNVKLNSVYAIGGPKCLVKTITKISGLNINHFIGMDFVAFRKIVDTVGGVYVCSTTPLYDYEIGTVLPKAGRQKLNGRKALKYVRARMISTEGNGDYGRIKRQQLFMSSLLRSTLSGNVLSNPGKLNRVARTFTRNSYVDNVDTQSLLDLADSMRGIDAGRVTFITIPTSGTSEDGQNNELPRDDDIQALFTAIIDDEPLPGEKPKPKPKKTADATSNAAAPEAATPSRVSALAMTPSNVGVRILNGTSTAGLAGHASEQLTPEGFEVRGIADSSQKVDATVVRYGPGQRDSAATVARMFPGAKIQLDRTVKSGVELILGSDYTMSTSLKSYATPGTKISAEQLPPRKVEANLPSDLTVTNAGDATCE
ncbi:LCP family protein [Gordonia crocea]|uniref:Putative transcriptional regulator n=1 Tax=Gordonia crocea TaxID=589162 RepID=A0A7I9UV98_9ACTN|nr:LCP family protein [Gordonia crocea]GED96873.1 putative transcriptional regulator [Gordonia crocea]